MRKRKIVLEGERVRLEPLHLKHVDELFDSANYKQIWTYTTSKNKFPRRYGTLHSSCSNEQGDGNGLSICCVR